MTIGGAGNLESFKLELELLSGEGWREQDSAQSPIKEAVLAGPV